MSNSSRRQEAMPEYRIVIPSYKRADLLKQKTLSYLDRCKVPRERVFVFVASFEEKDAYAKAIPGLKIVVAEPGLCKARAFIRNYHPEGQRIVSFDDDVESLVWMDGKKLKELTDLDGLIESAFGICERQDAKLWGVGPVPNPFYMENSVSCGLKFLRGPFFGFINDHDQKTYAWLDDKDDFERTIKYFIRDGKVVRFNNISMHEKYMSGAGGQKESRTKERIENTARKLAEEYPSYVKLHQKKDILDIRLKDPERSKSFKIQITNPPFGIQEQRSQENIPKTLKTFPIGDFQPSPRNAREHGEDSLEAIKFSLRTYGQTQPIVHKKGILVAGEGTWRAAKALGWTRIAAVETNLSEKALRAYALADNRTAELASWDDKVLAEFFTGESKEHLKELGWGDAEVEDLLRTRKDKDASPDSQKELDTIRMLLHYSVKEHVKVSKALEEAKKNNGVKTDFEAVQRMLKTWQTKK